MNAICSNGERACPPNSFGHAEADPSGLADIAREVGVELALVKWPFVELGLPVSRPVLIEPSPNLFAQLIAGRTEIVLRQRRAAAIQQVRGQPPPRIGRPTERDRVQVHALEMLRGLVLFGIADGAERMLGLERHAPQRVAAEGNRAIGEIAPIAVTNVVQPGRMIQDQADAFERDEAVREFVLDRLEFSDRLPELVTLFGVVHR